MISPFWSAVSTGGTRTESQIVLIINLTLKPPSTALFSTGWIGQMSFINLWRGERYQQYSYKSGHLITAVMLPGWFVLCLDYYDNFRNIKIGHLCYLQWNINTLLCDLCYKRNTDHWWLLSQVSTCSGGTEGFGVWHNLTFKPLILSFCLSLYLKTVILPVTIVSFLYLPWCF